jgi:YcxB-like protein
MQENYAQSIRYSSSRREVWRWYWRAWAKPKGLWRFHALFALTLAIAHAQVQGLSRFSPIVFLTTTALAMLGCMLVFSLWPQIRFKPAERTLSVGPAGWATQIGKLSAARSWNDVREIIEEDDTIVVVGTNQNALIIPSRAFADEENQRRFLTNIRTWHGAAAEKA